MRGFSICLIISDIWQGFEYTSGIKYVRVLNMPRYNYNSIIIATNIAILEFLPARFLHPGFPQLIILSFLTQVRRYKNNGSYYLSFSNEKFLLIHFSLVIKKQKMILYFFLTTMTSELSKYFNEQLGIFLNVKERKWS